MFRILAFISIILSILFVFLVISILGFTGVQAQTSDEIVTITWIENGNKQARSFEPGFNSWLSGTTGATTTIFSAFNPAGLGDPFEFVADDQIWHVNHVLGDINLDGIVDVFDAIAVLQIIVGLR